MLKLLTIIGARPQIIKAAALSRAIRNKFNKRLIEIIVHTSQHYDQNMSEVFFEELGIPRPHYNLAVGSGRHGIQTARMIEGIEDLIISVKPDYVVLYGDTNSTLAGGVAASKLSVPVVHIEAGLRSFNRKMPEEINRIVCDHLSTLLFSPTATGFNNLVNEGFNRHTKPPYTPDNPSIFHCGDIMYDNSLYFSEIAAEKSNILSDLNLKSSDYALATLHRDHNTDNQANFSSIIDAFIQISKNTQLVLPLHPRTKKVLLSDVNKSLYQRVKLNSNLKIIDPVSFLDMIQLEQNARLIMTDSGGVQKEAYFFNKPCIILRPETEWVEVLETGAAILAGADYDKITAAFEKLVNLKNIEFPEIFGDGHAAEFICETILKNNE